MAEEIKFHEQSEGWTYEHLAGTGCVCIERPQEIGGGYVTIDFKRRIFASGYGVPRTPVVPDMEYKGRDWKQKIVDDAVRYLETVMRR